MYVPSSLEPMRITGYHMSSKALKAEEIIKYLVRHHGIFKLETSYVNNYELYKVNTQLLNRHL